MKFSASLANSLWIAGSVPSWMAFDRALQRPEQSQQDVLRQIIATGADSAYGRACGLVGIEDYAEFARRVPLVRYDDLAPWIDRIRRGEPRVLGSGVVTHLIPTSGSTGARKLIPFTAGVQREFNRAIAPWITELAREHPGILAGPAYWSITPANEPALPEASSVPIGFADDASYLGGVKSWLVRAAMVGREISGTTDPADFRRRTLLSLLRERELRLISIWHPSFLTLLLDALVGNWSALLAALGRGNVRRLRELENADPTRPETIWPRLRMVSCWGDGHAALALTDLRRRMPGVRFQSKGLLATEAFVTIPWRGLHPVAVRSHFFEFIDAQGGVRLAHELSEGETYEVVVTTSGGLWRYRLGDQVQVDGFAGNTPSLRFLGRIGGVSDLCGEKLSEPFVAAAIRRSLAGAESQPRFVLLAPDLGTAGWHYTLFIEGEIPPGLGERLESALRENPQYAWCRELGQLGRVRVFAVSARGYETFAARLVSAGKRLGEIKPVALSTETGWAELFAGDYVAAANAEHPAVNKAG